MKKKGLFSRIFKFITDVISWTCLCLLILIGGCVVYYVIAARKYAARGEEYKPYFSLYTIISPSMEPNIKVYDVILDTRVDDPKNVKVGDVITFISTGSLSNGMVITHRVIDIINENGNLRFRTKGDNNQSPDGALVESENVLGKTLLRVPQLGRVQFLLASKGGWFIIVMIPAFGVIIYDILKLFKVSSLKTKVETALGDDNEDNKKAAEDQKKKEEEKRKEEIKKKLKLEEEAKFEKNIAKIEIIANYNDNLEKEKPKNNENNDNYSEESIEKESQENVNKNNNKQNQNNKQNNKKRPNRKNNTNSSVNKSNNKNKGNNTKQNDSKKINFEDDFLEEEEKRDINTEE